MSELTPNDQPYAALIQQIATAYQDGRAQASIAVNTHLVQIYGRIGQYIVEFEQAGKQRAEYGKGLLPQLREDLRVALGKGFRLSNVKRMRQVYLEFPISGKASHVLSSSISSQLFVNKYQRYLPNQEELTRLIESHVMEN